MTTSESKGRFFTKRIESNRFESRIGMLYRSYALDRAAAAAGRTARHVTADDVAMETYYHGHRSPITVAAHTFRHRPLTLAYVTRAGLRPNRA